MDQELENIISSMSKTELNDMKNILASDLWICSLCDIKNSSTRFKCTNCNNSRFSNNDQSSTTIKELSQHITLNTSKISEILHLVHNDNVRPPLLSFIFDAYNLIRYNQLL
eukprot:271025_1